jgi:FAD/FMN-containing dehydrogenase
VAYESWGRYPAARPAEVRRPFWTTDDVLAGRGDRPLLAYGQGRSYGDSCLNDGGVLVDTRGLDRFLAFDEATGVLRCEAGVTLAQILEAMVPRGWFLPVVPGTKFVSVGGAIANDIHGKNHHRAGTFGRHVRGLELLRSTGERRRCSPEENAELFAATVGGLGLTGLVLAADVQLRRVESAWVDRETVPFGGLDGFFEASGSSDRDWEFTVAWVDCVARGPKLGRGLFHRGNLAGKEAGPALPTGRQGPRVPIDLPGFTLNRFTVSAFNALYHWKGRRRLRERAHYEPFFFPLDGLREWNRIYGPEGLLQFQCVVPHAAARDAIRELLLQISAAGSASFLAVLKAFGDVPSPGMLSFPRPGITLALDFPNRGAETFALLARLADVTRAAGGAFYPAKDARMTREDLAASYPRLDAFRAHVDPAFSSSFWRRVAA